MVELLQAHKLLLTIEDTEVVVELVKLDKLATKVVAELLVEKVEMENCQQFLELLPTMVAAAVDTVQVKASLIHGPKVGLAAEDKVEDTLIQKYLQKMDRLIEAAVAAALGDLQGP
jgi:hypothetical protein